MKTLRGTKVATPKIILMFRDASVRYGCSKIPREQRNTCRGAAFLWAKKAIKMYGSLKNEAQVENVSAIMDEHCMRFTRKFTKDLPVDEQVARAVNRGKRASAAANRSNQRAMGCFEGVAAMNSSLLGFLRS